LGHRENQTPIHNRRGGQPTGHKGRCVSPGCRCNQALEDRDKRTRCASGLEVVVDIIPAQGSTPVTGDLAEAAARLKKDSFLNLRAPPVQALLRMGIGSRRRSARTRASRGRIGLPNRLESAAPRCGAAPHSLHLVGQSRRSDAAPPTSRKPNAGSAALRARHQPTGHCFVLLDCYVCAAAVRVTAEVFREDPETT